MHNLWFLLIAVLPSLVLIFYIFRKDRLHPEPPMQLMKAFTYGMLSGLLAMAASALLMGLGLHEGSPDQSFSTNLSLAFWGAAVPEEFCKLLMLWLFLRKCADFDEHVDGIVYAVCVGMGFAALENCLYIFSELYEGGHVSWADAVTGTLQLSITRGLLSVPGHFGFAVLMGYFYSCAHFTPQRKTEFLIWAFVAPVAAHTLFDLVLFETSYVSTGLQLLLMALFFVGFFFLQKQGSKRIAASLREDAEREMLERQEYFPEVPEDQEDQGESQA